jgi:type IV pilus modification protein PilV
MEMSVSSIASRKRAGGFTILEVLVAVLVLTFGVLSVAAVIGGAVKNSGRSQYMSTAAMLATEKLEDLSRLPATDLALQMPSGAVNNTAGSLTTPTTNVTIGSCNVDYTDTVYVSVLNGQFSEITSAPGNQNYIILTHLANGTVMVVGPTTAPNITSDMVKFTRLWTVERDPTINGATMSGVNRITVLAKVDGAIPVSYQASMLKQYPASGGTGCDEN